jgi:hypothetical protein
LIAAPGTPKAQEMPSFSSTRTAASTARILAMASLHFRQFVNEAIMPWPKQFLNFFRIFFHSFV